ncbi:hypothetical protein ACQBAU_06230 [Propionibacteriaceae bacterium Y2011]|uniref:hypothetical protein n=1 Tax=Microlunatus sp. Y2014 TaxID=3418488 RepID=UPI003B49069E
MRPQSTLGRVVVIIAAVISATGMFGIGLWCWLEPQGFARWANWPAHDHFLHDAGVFQMAIGLMVAAALWWRDALGVGLAGIALTNVLHAWNHWADREIGGHPSDPYGLLAVGVLAAVGLVLRLRHKSRSSSGETDRAAEAPSAEVKA